MKKTQAYLDGVRAYFGGFPITDNPYDSEKKEHSEFREGWGQAAKFDQVYPVEETT